MRRRKPRDGEVRVSSPREVFLVGSVPLAPAAAVFDAVGRHLGPLAPRIPDGEQIGWLTAAFRSFAANPALEVSRRVPLSAGGGNPIDIFRLRPGVRAEDVRLGPYGYADNAAKSYAAFVEARNVGKIAPGTRLQVTIPGPGTSAYAIELPPPVLLPMARKALAAEVAAIVRAIPAADLALQIDVAMEAEHEEYRRRPAAWDQPMHTVFDWSLDEMAESVAWLANRIPDDVELGFHICSIWHHDPGAGQDNRVLADAANAILGRLERPVGFIHIPIIPDHAAADYAALRALDLPADTRLYLGLINLADGLDGARQRVAMAEAAGISDFGVAMFCGLGRPPAAGTPYRPVPIPALTRATPDTIGAVLDLHRAVAEL
jgi:hypothetical protein